MAQNQEIKIENVRSVYSGINGRCACGCSGKHTYASQHQAWVSKNRGYEVDSEEINDKVVKMIVNKINKNISDADIDESYASVELGNRLYIAYLVH